MRVRPVVLSYGGGLDSWVMLLEAVGRGEHIDVVVFVDVGAPGHPGEWPSTYRHIDEVVKPFCARHGIRFVAITHELYPVRDAKSLFQWLWDRDQIPVSGDDRICTIIAKVERFEKWLDDTYPGQEVTVWVGFDAAEEKRVANDPNAGQPRTASYMKHRGGKNPGRREILHNSFRWARGMAFAMTHARRINRFPLVEWGLCRCRCLATAHAAGFPVPRKSACVFCPYGTKGDYQRLLVELPETFALVERLEAKKPPTAKNGRKLSIKAYDSKTQTGTPIREFASGSYRKPQKPCHVCGAAVKASKDAGCSYAEAA